jgi:hypothetical protein
MAFVAIKMDRRQGALGHFCLENQLIDPAVAGPKSCDLRDRKLFQLFYQDVVLWV